MANIFQNSQMRSFLASAVKKWPTFSKWPIWRLCFQPSWLILMTNCEVTAALFPAATSRTFRRMRGSKKKHCNAKNFQISTKPTRIFSHEK